MTPFAAGRAVDRQLWIERGKSFEQRISANLRRQIPYRYFEHGIALRSVLSDEVVVHETVQAFLEGRLTAGALSEIITVRDSSLSTEPAVMAIAQPLVDVYTTAVATDAELSRIVTLKRSDALAGQVSEVQLELQQQRQILTDLARSSALAGKPKEALSESERYDRAIAEVASAHNLSVAQLRQAISRFSSRVSSDAGASDFDQALAMIGEQDFAHAEIRAQNAVERAGETAEHAIERKRKALLLLGDIQMTQLKYSAAEKTYREAFAIAEQQDILYAADAGWRLSRLLADLGRYDEAVALATRFLAVAERHFGEPGTMVALNHLGLALQGAGRYQEAERILRRALELWESRSNTEDLMLATHLHNFSTVLRDLGKRREAEPIARRALAIRERYLGKHHPDVATCLTNVALLLDAQGKLAEAEPLLRTALASYQKYLPQDHPYCVTATSNLGMNLKDQGKLDQAEPLLTAVVEATRRVFGREHPRFGDSLNNLGELLIARGKLQDAIATLREAVAIYRRLLGPEHPTTQIPTNNLGSALVFAKEYVDAEQLFRETLAIKEKVMPGDHISIAHTVNNLGFALYMQRRFDEAELFFRRAIALRTEALPPTHAQLGNSIGNLGLLLYDAKRYLEAEDAFRRELEIRERQLPKSTTHTALALNNLGATQYLGGKLQDAAQTFERAVKYCRNEFGGEHQMTKDAVEKLSVVHARISSPP